jgi:DNA-binding phage protein
MRTEKLELNEIENFSISEHLDSPETIAAYLTDILESNDPALLAAKCTGITREALYKALRNNASPRFETVAKVCSAFGVKLVAQAMH